MFKKSQLSKVGLQWTIFEVYQVVFVKKITAGDSACEILKKIDKLLR